MVGRVVVGYCSRVRRFDCCCRRRDALPSLCRRRVGDRLCGGGGLLGKSRVRRGVKSPRRLLRGQPSGPSYSMLSSCSGRRVRCYSKSYRPLRIRIRCLYVVSQVLINWDAQVWRRKAQNVGSKRCMTKTREREETTYCCRARIDSGVAVICGGRLGATTL
jgi:hypothetical protein